MIYFSRVLSSQTTENVQFWRTVDVTEAQGRMKVNPLSVQKS